MNRRAAVAAMAYGRSFDGCGGLPFGARAAKDLRCCSVFGAARNATPYPRSTYQADVAATA